jgi:hypothetical protein
VSVEAAGAPNVTETSDAVTTAKSSAFEQRFVLYCITIALILAAIPCAIGYAASHAGYEFVGAAYNIDDTSVYFAWTKQAVDGHFYIRNLFTTEPQNAIQFNVLILMLGAIVRVTSLSIPVVFFITRLIASGFLLILIYRLYRFLAPNNEAARIYALLFVSVGSGFGFMFWGSWRDKNIPLHLPVDTWQPEALTFQSIEMSTLFAFSQILIVATIFLLAVGLRTGRMRYAACAGICALLLGNVHSYDIVHVAAAWLLYLIVLSAVNRRFDRSAWLQAIVCAGMAMPSVLYQLHMYVVDPMFHIRAHDLTLSPSVIYYLLGWGIVFLTGAGAAIYWIASRFESVKLVMADRAAALLPICWFIAGLAVSYWPHLNFQRKMIMGADIPISLLGGCGVSILAMHLSKAWRPIAAGACLLLSIPTTLLWLDRDVRHVLTDSSETNLSPFLDADELSALQWIRDNTTSDSAILGFPSLMDFVPAWCDRYTYVSHWGETPEYTEKVAGFVHFAEAGMPEQARIDYLISTKSDYFVFPNALNGSVEPGPDGRMLAFEDFHRFPDILQPLYSNKELTIYKILLVHPPK